MSVSDRGYAIIGTPRSGSSHLCRLLTSTGVLGKPAEYLHPNYAAQVTGEQAAAPGDVWESILALSRTDNGVYAIKAFRAHLGRFVDEGIHCRIFALPLVYVTRRDKLGQAISLARAMQTRQWSSEEHASRTPEYSAIAIRNCLDRILINEIAFMQMIALHDLPTLFLTYEEFVAAPLQTVQMVSALVGVEGISVPPQSPLAVQRDGISTAWRARFVAEQGAPLDIPTFAQTDRWSRLGRRLRRIKRRLPFMTSYGDYLD